jgi:hypothetical protein
LKPPGVSNIVTIRYDKMSNLQLKQSLHEAQLFTKILNYPLIDCIEAMFIEEYSELGNKCVLYFNLNFVLEHPVNIHSYVKEISKLYSLYYFELHFPLYA